MSTRQKVASASALTVLVAVGAFFLLGNRPADIPVVGAVLEPSTCPLTGLEPRRESLLDQPAVAVKVENNAVAYPLSGLEKADVVYEELVEGGLTRFMAIYHCTNASKVGPIRSSRTIDPAIMLPATRLLAAAGGNGIVRKVLSREDVILLDEPGSGEAMRRVERPGVTSEHTLYGDTAKLRAAGNKRFDDPPPDDIFRFGDLGSQGKRARTITIEFSPAASVSFSWSDGRWRRSDNGAPTEAETGEQLAADNVVILQHEVNLSKTIVDVSGTPSIEIANPTGSGTAALFRDGRVFRGRWTRESTDEPVRLETRAGDEMVLHPGTTWVELVPNNKGEVKGSFDYAK